MGFLILSSNQVRSFELNRRKIRYSVNFSMVNKVSNEGRYNKICSILPFYCKYFMLTEIFAYICFIFYSNNLLMIFLLPKLLSSFCNLLRKWNLRFVTSLTATNCIVTRNVWTHHVMSFPPADEKKMGTIWIFVYYAVYGSGRGKCRDFLVLKWGGGVLICKYGI